MGRLLAAVVAATAATVLVVVSLSILAGAPEAGVAGREGVAFGTVPTRAVTAPVFPEAAGRAPTIPAAPVPAAAEVPALTAPLVPVVSGLLSSLPAEPVNRPVGIRIADLAISSDVAPVGYDADKDQMEVPASASLVGWYEFSASPGKRGSAVLAAHVDWNGREGTFFDLHTIEVGAVVTIEYADGSERHFEVFAARQYDKQVLPVDEIFSKEGGPVLTLVTCGGLFDGSRGSYRDNMVVYARPAASFVEAPAVRN